LATTRKHNTASHTEGVALPLPHRTYPPADLEIRGAADHDVLFLGIAAVSLSAYAWQRRRQAT
jgi:hypothetical protein